VSFPIVNSNIPASFSVAKYLLDKLAVKALVDPRAKNLQAKLRYMFLLVMYAVMHIAQLYFYPDV
jgi:hypothetical protein